MISRKRSYHGTTHGVLWLGGDRSDLDPSLDRRDFEPIYPGTLYAPQPDPYSCDLGGVTPSECAVRCADAIEQLILAQGVISSYLPMAAVIAGKHVADAFAGEGNVFSSVLTFGGHPVASAAALANIKILEEENLIDNSNAMGIYLLEQLEGVKTDHSIVGDVRGLGLLATIELVKDRETKERFPDKLGLNDKLSEKFRRRRLIIRPRGTITLSPPLCVTRDEIDEIIDGIDGVLAETEQELGIAS